MTSEELKDIFYTGYTSGPNWQILDDIVIGISLGYIVFETRLITTINQYHTEIDYTKTVEGPGPQMRSHMALKSLAGTWLQKFAGSTVLYEAYLQGLHPDVRTSDGKYILECGTTDPACILIYLDSEDVIWVGNIPYPFDGEQSLTAHIFSRGTNYVLWRRKRHDILRNQFQQFHS